jgi:mono/diheme cytochrome c family protein
MASVQRLAAWLSVLGLAGLLLGCGQTNAPTTSAPAAEAPKGPPVKAEASAEAGPSEPGKKVFAASGCAKCHTLGVGGGPGLKKGRGRGPDLAKVGQGPTHTAEWVAEYIRNPKMHKANSRMPAFEGKINADDLRILAEYLAGLK